MNLDLTVLKGQNLCISSTSTGKCATFPIPFWCLGQCNFSPINHRITAQTAESSSLNIVQKNDNKSIILPQFQNQTIFSCFQTTRARTVNAILSSQWVTYLCSTSIDSVFPQQIDTIMKINTLKMSFISLVFDMENEKRLAYVNLGLIQQYLMTRRKYFKHHSINRNQ